jgi:predicted transcriptional regulator YdeE
MPPWERVSTMPEPTFVDREAFSVLGLQEHFTRGTEDFEGIWKRFMAYHDEIAAHSTDGAYYGVACAPDEGEGMDYLAGMAVPPGTPCPEGLTIREVGAAHYAVFECTVATISETYGFIHGEWLPGSDYVHQCPKPDFEQYPPGTDSADSPVLLHIPVAKRDQ